MWYIQNALEECYSERYGSGGLGLAVRHQTLFKGQRGRLWGLGAFFRHLQRGTHTPTPLYPQMLCGKGPCGPRTFSPYHSTRQTDKSHCTVRQTGEVAGLPSPHHPIRGARGIGGNRSVDASHPTPPGPVPRGARKVPNPVWSRTGPGSEVHPGSEWHRTLSAANLNGCHQTSVIPRGPTLGLWGIAALLVRVRAIKRPWLDPWAAFDLEMAACNGDCPVRTPTRLPTTFLRDWKRGQGPTTCGSAAGRQSGERAAGVCSTRSSLFRSSSSAPCCRSPGLCRN